MSNKTYKETNSWVDEMYGRDGYLPETSSKDVKEQGAVCFPRRWNFPSSTPVNHGMNSVKRLF